MDFGNFEYKKIAEISEDWIHFDVFFVRKIPKAKNNFIKPICLTSQNIKQT